jgi:acetylornithine deacetylase/succinyl-diaminopimelate desuccinylase-like protein
MASERQHESMSTAAGVPTRQQVAALMPRLTDDLRRLVAIPSISAWGFPEETHGPLLEAYAEIVELLRDAGIGDVGALELPGTAPIIVGELPGPPGAPTVLLYGHYDVVAAGEEGEWTSPPFVLTERDGALYGRGAADSKANVLVHVGALRAWGGRPPVGIRILIEGQEEVGSPLEDGYPSEHPERFRADAILVADGGSLRAGEPSLTVSLRGDARITVEVRTLGSNKHAGQYGGAAPDALTVLLRALASLWDESGDVAVPGLRREEWTGASIHRRRVPRAGGDRGRLADRRDRRNRLQDLERPRHHRVGDRLPGGRRRPGLRAGTRACAAQRARAP